MRKVKSPEDLTIEELRQLLVEKQRRRRQEHLERFRRTGRVVTLASDIAPTSLDHLVTNRAETTSDTATPIKPAVVLPSGHTPPNSPGGSKFNEEEIPEHLRPLMQSLLEVPIPT